MIKISFMSLIFVSVTFPLQGVRTSIQSKLAVNDSFDTVFYEQGLKGLIKLYDLKEKNLNTEKLQEEIRSSLLTRKCTDPYLYRQHQGTIAYLKYFVKIPFSLGILSSGIKVAYNWICQDSIKPISTALFLGSLAAYYQKAYKPAQALKKEEEASNWLLGKRGQHPIRER